MESDSWCSRCFYEFRTGKRKEVAKVSFEIEVPSEFASASLKDFPTATGAQIKCWPRKEKNMAIMGTPGTGKTRTCWLLQMHAAKHGVRVHFEYLPTFRTLWVQTMHREMTERQLFKAPFLILDDLSGCSATDGWSEFMQRLLDARWNGGAAMPTLITTASTLEQLASKYGEAIASRLSAQRFSWVGLPNKDHRKGRA